MAKKTLRAKCLEAIQLRARLTYADDKGICECVSCGIKQHYKDMDGGHYIPKGASSYWALEVENVHPQCKGCNGFGMKYGTAAQQYTNWMIDYYGREFVNHMLATKSNIKKIYKADYEDMLKTFNADIKDNQDRVGG